jgi:hypothetical protein
VTSAFEKWIASLGGNVSDYARPLLHEIFAEDGPASREQTQVLFRGRQLAMAREAVALVARDIARTTRVEPPPFAHREDDDGIWVSYRGCYATTPISGVTQAQITAEVADFMQEEVMEHVWDRLASVPYA